MSTTHTPVATGRAPESSASAEADTQTPTPRQAQISSNETTSTAHQHQRPLARFAAIALKRRGFRAPPPAHDPSDAEQVAATTPSDAELEHPNHDAETRADSGDEVQTDQDSETSASPHNDRRQTFLRVLSVGVTPALTMLLALAGAYLKYDSSIALENARAATESVQAAKDSTIAILSYTPDSAETKLTAARDRLTGTFRDAYTSLTHDVVIPGAKQKQISATATVPAAASMSASENRAVVLVFVDQAIIMGNDAPTQTASVVQVTLEKSGNRWLVSSFEPK